MKVSTAWAATRQHGKDRSFRARRGRTLERLNEIVFPAAILQPPFFNPKADDAVN
jgi:hypothetical protein